MSHLIRGAWIEITIEIAVSIPASGRISYEVRGLKYQLLRKKIHILMSHLIRGAWIEIYFFGLEESDENGRISYEVRGLK